MSFRAVRSALVLHCLCISERQVAFLDGKSGLTARGGFDQLYICSLPRICILV